MCDSKGMKSVRFNLGDVIVGTRGGLVRSKSSDNLLGRKVILAVLRGDWHRFTHGDYNAST